VHAFEEQFALRQRCVGDNDAIHAFSSLKIAFTHISPPSNPLSRARARSRRESKAQSRQAMWQSAQPSQLNVFFAFD